MSNEVSSPQLMRIPASERRTYILKIVEFLTESSNDKDELESDGPRMNDLQRAVFKVQDALVKTGQTFGYRFQRQSAWGPWDEGLRVEIESLKRAGLLANSVADLPDKAGWEYRTRIGARSDGEKGKAWLRMHRKQSDNRGTKTTREIEQDLSGILS